MVRYTLNFISIMIQILSNWEQSQKNMERAKLIRKWKSLNGNSRKKSKILTKIKGQTKSRYQYIEVVVNFALLCLGI